MVRTLGAFSGRKVPIISRGMVKATRLPRMEKNIR